MKAEMVQRLIELSRKSGDRLVVVEGDSGIVILPLERYEDLLGASQGVVRYPDGGQSVPSADPIERANQAVADLQDPSAKADDIKAVFDSIQGAGEPGEEQFYLEPVE